MRDDTHQHEPYEIEPMVPRIAGDGARPDGGRRRPAGDRIERTEPTDTGYATPETRDREGIEPMVPDLG